MSAPLRAVLLALALLVPLAAMLWHGPIPQLDHYHDFADQRGWLGVMNAMDVLSNLPFAVIGVLGLRLVAKHGGHPSLRAGRGGYALFFGAMVLTALGSSWYHLVPDNARLVWDRVPIALACAGIVNAVWAEQCSRRWAGIALPWLIAYACLSVAWWRVSDFTGLGDLRPYLLLQGAPLLLIPLMLGLYPATRGDRQAFAMAILFYLAAKACELADHTVFAQLGLLSGHTLKHLLAAAAGLVIWHRLAQRIPGPIKCNTLRQPAYTLNEQCR